MRDGVSQIPAWTWIALAAALAPLAAWLGAQAAWTPGAASLAVLLLPISAAALAGQRNLALGAAGIFSLGCLLEVLLTGRATIDSPATWAYPALAACAAVAAATTVSSAAGALREKLARLEEQNTHYVREMYRRERAAGPDDSSGEGGSSQPHEGRVRIADELEKVDQAMLLLTLQDVGRRISLNLDNDALVPTIVNTARASLKCGRCGLWFWNAAEGALRAGHGVRATDVPRYLPRADAGMARWVIEHRQILTRRAVEEDYALRALLEEDPGLPDAVAPLLVGGELIGLLVVDEIEAESPNFLRLLYILANIYALGIKNRQLFRRIEDMARRDGLTGLFNHVAFQQRLDELVGEAERTGGPLAVIMSDIDRFKRFNDEHGHQAGDHVLAEAARLWRAVVPEWAFVARYGGEEFICALPNAGQAEGAETAERLREALEAHPFEFDGRTLRVTASFGVAEFGAEANTPSELVRRADAALYRAKENGRNRVVLDQEPAEVA
ncbi:MAG: sensor domain-containing diguanylate cyclase [Planctomycetales bacterium]